MKILPDLLRNEGVGATNEVSGKSLSAIFKCL